MFTKIFKFLEKVEDKMELSGEEVSIAIKWRKDHYEILSLCQKVIRAYMANSRMGVKSNLKKLNTLLTDHFLQEDSELYSVSKQDLLPREILKKIDEHREEFREERVSILSSLSVYALPEKTLDEVFFEGFNIIYVKLMDRFKMEESELYSHMEDQCICKTTMALGGFEQE